jgi:hypothetical protein
LLCYIAWQWLLTCVDAASLHPEDKYAAIVGAQPGSFAFLFGLACKHPSEHVQKYAIHTLFSLSRNGTHRARYPCDIVGSLADVNV